MEKLTSKEKDVLNLALEQLDKYYEEIEKTCRQFKWICHKHLPQADTKENDNGYSKNKNVFEIQDKTIKDIQEAKKEGRRIIMKIINER